MVLSTGAQDLPLGAVDVLAVIQVLQPIIEHQVQLVTIIGPGAKLEVARLLIEWKVAHVNLTGGLVDGRWDPADEAVVVDCDELLMRLFLLVSAGHKRVRIPG